MADWYYAQGTVQRGPVAVEFVIDSLRSGVLRLDDLVWREGLPDWMPAGQMAELAGAWRVASPPRLPAAPAMAGFASMAATPFAPPPPPGSATPAQPVAPQPPLSPAPSHPHTPTAPPVRSPHASLAVTSVVLGLVAFMLLPLGSMLGVPGLVCGIIALRGMKQTGVTENRGVAIAGVVLGIFWAIVGALVVAAAALYFAVQPAMMNVSVSPPAPNPQPPAFSIRP